MKIISDKIRLKKFIYNENNIGFVPTMGSIHKGHISLINKSIDQCDKTIVSIFINKPQFNKKSDYLSYPKSIKKDIKILKSHKIDFLYIPSHKEIYPHGPSKKIKINVLKKGISSFVFNFAHKFSFIYGLFSAIIAIGLGLTAGFIFRRFLW